MLVTLNLAFVYCLEDYVIRKYKAKIVNAIRELQKHV